MGSLSLQTQILMGSGFVVWIMTAIPTVQHAFLKRDEAVPKSKTKGRSLGIEHASYEDLKTALAQVTEQFEHESQFDISRSDLIRLGFLAGADSRKRREYLGEVLRIGYSNGKQLIKRLECLGLHWQKWKKL